MSQILVPCSCNGGCVGDPAVTCSKCQGSGSQSVTLTNEMAQQLFDAAACVVESWEDHKLVASINELGGVLDEISAM